MNNVDQENRAFLEEIEEESEGTQDCSCQGCLMPCECCVDNQFCEKKEEL